MVRPSIEPGQDVVLVERELNQRSRFSVEGNSTPLAPRLAWQGGGNVNRGACDFFHAPPSSPGEEGGRGVGVPCEEGGRGEGVSRASRAGAVRQGSTITLGDLEVRRRAARRDG